MEVGSSGINAEFNPQWALLLELDGKLLCADQFCASLFKLSNRICRRLHREFEMLSEPKNHTLLESTRILRARSLSIIRQPPMRVNRAARDQVCADPPKIE